MRFLKQAFALTLALALLLLSGCAGSAGQESESASRSVFAMDTVMDVTAYGPNGEKAAVAWIFAGRHGAQGLTFGFEELKENGYIKENVLYWEDGLLMRIGETEKGSSAGTLRFNAQKWRAGDGAYCCKHVAAVLYGIGARLDKEPELFFTLRGIDPNSIVASEMVETLTGETENELEGANLGDVFGISLDGDAAAVAESPGEAAPEKAPEAAPEKKKKRGRPAKKKGATPLSPAERVRALRQKMGLSQAAFGKEIGTYQAVVSQMELGKAPSQFARALPLIERLEEKYGLAQ